MLRDFAGEILGVRELSEYLRVHPITVYRLASSGKLPGHKLAGRGKWRFIRVEVDRWIAEQPGR